MELEPVADLHPFAEHELVLRGVAGAERLGEDLFGGHAEELLSPLDAAPLEERVVDAHVPALPILGEKNDVRKLAEEFLEQGEFGERPDGARTRRHRAFQRGRLGVSDEGIHGSVTLSYGPPARLEQILAVCADFGLAKRDPTSAHRVAE